MKEVRCNECGKILFLTDKESDGAIGAEAQSKGFVFKMATLFSDKYNCLYFCNNECGKSFYQEHIPSNPEITKKLQEMRSKIPELSKECCIGLSNFISKIKK